MVQRSLRHLLPILACALAVWIPGVYASPSGPLTLPIDLQGQIHWLTKPEIAAMALSSDLRTRANNGDFSNQYVDVTVACDLTPGNKCEGNFGMGTTGGNPADPSDDGKPLIFGWPSHMATTFSSVWIDGNKMKYGETGVGGGTVITPPTVNAPNSSISMLWRYNQIDVEQRITLVNSLNNRADTAEITYYLTNNGASSSDVGVRVLLDTQIGNNDGAPINVVGFPFSEFEREFVQPNMPQYWQAFENTVSNPGLTAQGTLYGANATIPDRFVVAYWVNIAGVSQEVWDFTVNPAQSYIHPTGSSTDPDSAVAIWWNPRSLQPGQTIRFTTYYGLGTGSTCENDLSVNFTAPSTLAVIDCQYSPNPFDASLVMMNLTAFTATNVRATLMLPAGLQFVSPSTSVLPIGDLASNAQANGSWRIFADGTVTGTLTMHLTVESDTTAKCELDRDIEIPVVICTPTPTGTPPPTMTPLPTDTPTMTPTFTPYFSPTPTNTPDTQGPYIMAAGYGDTEVISGVGGNVTMYAWIDTLGLNDDDRVELHYQGQSLGGIELKDDGTAPDWAAGDHVYTFSTYLGGGLPPGLYLLELLAFDRAGNPSLRWPYFTIQAGWGNGPEPANVFAEIDAFVNRGHAEQVMSDSSLTARALPGKPVIFVGGYMTTKLTQNGGGEMTLLMITTDSDNNISGVELFYNTIPTGVMFRDDGAQGDFAAGDGVYGLRVPLSPPLTPLSAVLEARAYDLSGGRSNLWPYLQVIEPTPTNTPTQTPTPLPTGTPTPTPTPYPTPCFVFTEPTTGVQTSGEWVRVDASCSPIWEGTFLLYKWAWGDGDETDWSRSPLAEHIYRQPRDTAYIVTLTTRTEMGREASTSLPIKIIP